MGDIHIYLALFDHLNRVIIFSFAGVILPAPGIIRLNDRATGFALMNLSWLVANLSAVWWIADHQRSYRQPEQWHLHHVQEMMLANLFFDLFYLLIGWFLWQLRKGHRPKMRSGLAQGVIWQGLGLMFLDSWFLILIST